MRWGGGTGALPLRSGGGGGGGGLRTVLMMEASWRRRPEYMRRRRFVENSRGREERIRCLSETTVVRLGCAMSSCRSGSEVVKRIVRGNCVSCFGGGEEAELSMSSEVEIKL